MSLLRLCDEKTAKVPLEATVAEAIQVLLDLRVGALAVVDSDERVAGIFSERDVLRKLALSGKDFTKAKVRDYMTTGVISASEETTAAEALATMVEKHFRHLPIVGSNGRLLGLLSVRNLLEDKVEELTQQLDSLEQFVTNDSPGG